MHPQASHLAAISIQHCAGLNRTPALPLAVRGWAALVEAGHCSNVVQITAEQSAVLALVGGMPASVLTYSHDPLRKEMLVGLGYTLPDYRKRGLYGLLWDGLVGQARALEAAAITSATFIGNTAMRAAAARQGRAETQVLLDFAVPPVVAAPSYTSEQSLIPDLRSAS